MFTFVVEVSKSLACLEAYMFPDAAMSRRERSSLDGAGIHINIVVILKEVPTSSKEAGVQPLPWPYSSKTRPVLPNQLSLSMLWSDLRLHYRGWEETCRLQSIKKIK